MDSIKYNCPNCGHSLSIPVQYAGQRGACKHCKQQFTVPKVGAPLPSAATPPIPSFTSQPIQSANPRPNIRTEYRSFIGGFWGCIGVGVAICALCMFAVGGCVFLIGLGASQVERDRRTGGTAEHESSFLPSRSVSTKSKEPLVTLAEFNRIQEGMSYQQVVGIIGANGTVISENTIAGIHTVMYSWENQSFVDGNMNAMFQGDRLISKAQLMLE